jgi:hypothetical protein
VSSVWLSSKHLALLQTWLVSGSEQDAIKTRLSSATMQVPKEISGHACIATIGKIFDPTIP